jgi:dTDP-4-amino-4,6-dideoxygalactose transaminase
MITRRRLALWQHYHDALELLAEAGSIRRPIVPDHCRHNAHMYYLLLPDLERRTDFIAALKDHGIGAVFHYVPLHASPTGKQLCRTHGALPHTEELSGRLVRLPLWLGLEEHIEEVLQQILLAVGDGGLSRTL